MPVHYSALLSIPAADPTLTPVNLADLTAKQLACLLVAPPPHPLGVCRFVAQLLLVRGRGTCIWLCNVHPGLRRCLQQLGLAAVFHLNGQGKPTEAATTGLAPCRATLSYKTL